MTHRGDLVFVHVLQWPSGWLTLPALPQRIAASSVVTGGKVTVNQTDKGVELFVPALDRQALDTIVSLKLDARAAEVR
jgi:alpha-L-fucosidase